LLTFNSKYLSVLHCPRYSYLFVEKHEVFIPHLYLMLPMTAVPLEFGKRFISEITIMTGEFHYRFSRFGTIPDRDRRSDRQTNRQTSFHNICCAVHSIVRAKL